MRRGASSSSSPRESSSSRPATGGVWCADRVISSSPRTRREKATSPGRCAMSAASCTWRWATISTSRPGRSPILDQGDRMLRSFIAVTLVLFCAASVAQTAPRPLRILVPFSAGGASDTYSRIAALKITEQTGRPIVVENRTGAGGRIAWEAAAKSAPDGATAALIDATYAMLPGLFEKLPWDVAGDLVPAAMVCQTPFVITVNAGSRSEERRVGKECRSRRAPEDEKKKGRVG